MLQGHETGRTYEVGRGGGGINTSHCKHVTKCYTRPRTSADYLARPKQRRNNMTGGSYGKFGGD
jgi:hypothetical protein